MKKANWKYPALFLALAGFSLGAIGGPFLGVSGGSFGVSAAIANPGPGGPFGGGGHHGPGGEMLVPLLFAGGLTDDQKEQVHQILETNRDTMKGIFQQLHTAEQSLATKLLTSGSVSQADLEPTLNTIATLRGQLADNGAAVALQVRALMTPAQIAQAADTFTKMSALRQQERQLLNAGK